MLSLLDNSSIGCCMGHMCKTASVGQSSRTQEYRGVLTSASDIVVADL
jgi:hypothetical protein